MTAVHPPIPSGVPAVDRQWGGLATGKAYLLAGRAGAGRSALALQMAQAALAEGIRTLLMSPREPSALVETGQSVGFDLPQAHASGDLRILRIPDVETLSARGAEGLQKSYRDLIGMVETDRPGRVVLEDFTPLVQFDTFERFHDAFAGLVDALERAEATLVVGLGDPANDASRRLLEVVESLVHGSIRLGADGALHLATRPEATDADAPGAELGPAPEAKAEPAPDAPAPPSSPSADAHQAPAPVASPSPLAAPAPEAPTPEAASPE
ncbi:MAG: ATPase domain-containing protein, partial [Bacteroidota bacterium]